MEKKLNYRRTLYIRDEVWGSIKDRAKAENRTVSNYLVNIHGWYNVSEKPGKIKEFGLPSQLEVIEKLDLAEMFKADMPKIKKVVGEREEAEEPEVTKLEKKLESVTKKIDHAIEAAGKKEANQDWRADISSRPKGQDGKKK